MAEYLVFDGETLDGPISCEDLSGLRAVVKKGSNPPHPYVDGVVPLATRLDSLDVTLSWSVVGRTDPSGTAHSNWETGVESNIEHYRSLFTEDPDADTGQHAVALHYAGQVFEGYVQVRNFASVRTGPTTATLITRMEVAAGELVSDGS
jgi:hypothetical protein